MKDILKIVVPLLFLAGGIWAILYWLYPYMEAHTSNPVLYTILVIGGVFAVQFLFSRSGQSLAGMFFIGDLLKIIN